ncbi:TPR domain-containing protein [Fusarium flagelliforme]|uniref:TPR domain-containing protein n=1 Tax=Fusarium flagelliforme TaxID=2675880 RepID=UPI001E8E7129|nr:TPR domain-containing protein [Fusarium flagelliforme]KAH7188102.1 TPR domain-containing protein [Fusarium flagelliforme]
MTRHLRSRDLADLEVAINEYELVLESTPEGHVHLAARLGSLGTLYLERYGRTGIFSDLDLALVNGLGNAYKFRYERSLALNDIDMAIQERKAAINVTKPDHSDRIKRLYELGCKYTAGYRRTETIAELNEGIHLFQKGYEAVSNDDPLRTSFIGSLGTCYEDRHKRTKIASTSMDLVPFLTPWFLANADKQHLVTEMSNFAGDAAAVALRAGQPPGTAIHLLEQGRGIISSSLNEMRRDLSDLENAYPDQARKLSKLREELDSPENSAGVDQRYSSAEMLESLIKEIRSLPGFDRFLLPPTEEDIKAAASHGPIVVLNASQYRCTALVLGWLWDTIASPVLEFLGMHESSTDHWPRIWWIPVGILSKFPIHGAGYHVSGLGCTVLDRVISSYSSSIKAMIHSRRSHTSTRELSRSKNAILVGVETTPGHRRLPYITEEVQRLEDFCNAPYLTIKRREPYRQEVIDTLRDCDIFHFAGHRLCDSNDPSGSALLLGDGPLTVETLLEMNMQRRRPFLAYLSASGFQHVIGTLWQVDDKFSVNVAIMMYEWMQKHDMGGAAVSEGLHHTSRMFRDKWISG